MNFVESIRAIAVQIPAQMEHLTTEEATKHALVMPFINCMGYNVFDPREVVPEFTADHGTKKGEKVDYAIVMNGTPIILFECKKCGEELSRNHCSQLYRYFSVTKARVGVLTNGIQYRFYSDLDEKNKMDERPYLEIDLLHFDPNQVAELERLAKASFDIEKVLSAASELKYSGEIKKLLAANLKNPSDEFVRLLVSHVYGGRFTQSVKEQFVEIVRRSFRDFINDQINARLQSALDQGGTEETVAPEGQEQVEAESPATKARIRTTPEEVEGFHIVKAILREAVDPSRVHHRDTISYFGILLDDNNRKPICRLHFNNLERMQIGLFDKDKNEERYPIDTLDGIYQFADRLKETAGFYD